MVTARELLRRLGLTEPTEADLQIAADILDEVLESAARCVERSDATLFRLAARVRLLRRPPGWVPSPA